MKATFAAVVALALVAGAYGDGHIKPGCPNHRGCNPPTPYSKLAFGKDAAPIYKESKNFPADMKEAIDQGHQAVINFAGSVDPVFSMMFEAEGTDDDYKTVTDSLCSDLGCCDQCITGYPGDQGLSVLTYAQANAEVRQAKDGAPGKYYSGTSKEDCSCNQKHVVNKALYYQPGKGEAAAGVGHIASHEYFHAVQFALGGYPPAWLIEGGAVHVQCLLASKLPKMDFGSGPMSLPYSQCYEFGGGRQGILHNTLEYYKSDIGKANGLKIAEDWCCGDSCGAVGKQLGQLDHVYYDAGAYAIAFAINRAKSNSTYFINNPEEGKGFWRNIKPWDGYDYVKDHASACPEGKGWRKAFTAFTGDANMDAFYAAFDKHVRDAMDGKTDEEAKAELKKILETDDDVVAMAAKKYEYEPRSTPVMPTCDATGKPSSPVTDKPSTPGPSPAGPSPANPAPKKQTPKEKLDAAKTKLDAAKKKVTEKKAAATTKRAAAKTKRATAQAKLDELLGKEKYSAEQKKMIKVLSTSAMDGVKLANLIAKGIKATNDTEACTMMCSKSKIDCEKVVCQPSADGEGDDRRRLLAEKNYEVQLSMNPNEVDPDAALAELKKDTSLQTAKTESEPDSLFGEIGLDEADATALKSATTEAGTAETEAKAAEAEATAAEKEQADVAKEVTTAETEVAAAAASPPPPAPPPVLVSGGSGVSRFADVTTAVLMSVMATVFLALSS